MNLNEFRALVTRIISHENWNIVAPNVTVAYRGTDKSFTLRWRDRELNLAFNILIIKDLDEDSIIIQMENFRDAIELRLESIDSINSMDSHIPVTIFGEIEERLKSLEKEIKALKKERDMPAAKYEQAEKNLRNRKIYPLYGLEV